MDDPRACQDPANAAATWTRGDRITAFLGVLVVPWVTLWTAAEWDGPYGYYTLLRIVIFLVSSWIIWFEFVQKDRLTPWATIFGLLAILFNPVIPIHLDRETWKPIDICAPALFFLYWCRLHWWSLRDKRRFLKWCVPAAATVLVVLAASATVYLYQNSEQNMVRVQPQPAQRVVVEDWLREADQENLDTPEDRPVRWDEIEEMRRKPI